MHYYWVTTGSAFKLYGRSFAGKGILTRNRFFSIWAFLHVSDPDLEDPLDRLAKVRPLLDHLNECCQLYFQPSRQIAINERMVKSKGRFPMRQYIKTKPVKWGFKLWCLCDSATGYTWCFSVYRGKQGETRSENGLAYDVVISLVEGLMKLGYRVYVDNFYSSPVLFKYLKENGFEACGTCDINRRGCPDELKQLKAALSKARVERGEGYWVRDGNLVFVLWKDTKVVSVMSTMHQATGTATVERKFKDKDGHLVRKQVPIPPPIEVYNKNMGGVDLSDQYISYYNILHKTRKY